MAKRKGVGVEEYMENQVMDISDAIRQPFSVDVTIEGTSDLLFHRYCPELIEEQAKQVKGAKSTKMDHVEYYVYRNDDNQICLPSRYIVRSTVEQGRNHKDPRSARKMAKELVQAGLMCEEILSPMLVNGEPVEDWDYLDKQRVCIMRAAITRSRPAFKKGWRCNFTLTSLLPEYITPDFLRVLVEGAGKFVGLGDYRPTYGRFAIVKWDLREAA